MDWSDGYMTTIPKPAYMVSYLLRIFGVLVGCFFSIRSGRLAIGPLLLRSRLHIALSFVTHNIAYKRQCLETAQIK
jgi:hypothetical protein